MRRLFNAFIVMSVAAGLTLVVTGPVYAATLPTGAHSLESVNFPGRYIRHANSLGRLETVTSSSTAQTKQDATCNT